MTNAFLLVAVLVGLSLLYRYGPRLLRAAMNELRRQRDDTPPPQTIVRVPINNPLAHVTFDCFLAQVTRPDESDPAPARTTSTVSAQGLKRALDLVPSTLQAFETATRSTVEFSEKAQLVLNNGGQLMQSGSTSLPVVTDASGKIFEIGRIVGASTVPVGLSVYAAAVTVAWMLVASDLKKRLEGVEIKLEELLTLHKTAEVAEMEAAYESIRFVTNPDDPDTRAAIFHAVTVAKEARSRCRQRLEAQADRLASPSLAEKIFQPKKWRETDRQEIEAQVEHLATFQLAVLMETHALRLLGDRERGAHFGSLMTEEASRLKTIGAQYTAAWEAEAKRINAPRPVLMTAIDQFADALTLNGGSKLKIMGT